ncbi:MAG: phospho-sugar mutase, partial [Planctomycetota bacterium]
MLEERLARLLEEGKIGENVYKNALWWLEHIGDREEMEALLDRDLDEFQDAFWQTLPFGTGGRRGKMGIGQNRIGVYTVQQSAQGIANYLLEVASQEGEDGGDFRRLAVVAYDTRHGSEDFARMVAQVFAANGIRTLLYPSARSTPQLSFTVRHLGADVGVMISASHNPPTDNGLKVYWRDGGQVLPPHDEGIIRCVELVEEVRSISFQEGLEGGGIGYIGEEVDRAYWEVVLESGVYSGEREVRVVYSPLHGVGKTSVYEVLKRAGFRDIFLVSSQEFPDGDFPNVKDHLPNPELPGAMEEALRLAEERGADLALVSDPDADRIGVGVSTSEGWKLLSGNQIATLIFYHLVEVARGLGVELSASWLMKTLVTTELLERIARRFRVRVRGDLPVGFKYIAHWIEGLREGERFLFGAEESYGFLLSSRVRDKDAAMAGLALAQIASRLKKESKDIWQNLKEIYKEFGYFCNLNHSFVLPGARGRERMGALMGGLRSHRLERLGGLGV